MSEKSCVLMFPPPRAGGGGEMMSEGHTITVRSLRLVKEGVGVVWRDWGTWHHW